MRRKPMKTHRGFPKKGAFKRTHTVVVPNLMETNPNRVLFLCSVFCSRALKDYLVLTKKGFDVFVGHIGGNNKHLQYIKEGRSIVYQMTRPNIKKTIQNVKPDIIHVHNSPNIPAVWARSCFSGPIVLDIHDSRKKDQQAAMDAVNYIFTVHDEYAKTIKGQFNVKKEIEGVPSIYWIDFEPLERFDDVETHLCFIGSMYGPPTAHRWCEAFKKMANRLQVHIHIHVNYFHDIVKKYQDDYLHLEDEISFMDIPQTLSKYDAGIIPPGSAMSLPNKFFDYVNAGIPIIVDPNRKLVSDYVKKYDVGIIKSLEELTPEDINSVFDKRDKVDYRRIQDIKTVSQLKPYSTTNPLPLKKMGTIVQTKSGSCIIGNIHFYDYTTTTPKNGMTNIPYIRDLPSIQAEYAKYTDKQKLSFLNKFSKRVQNIDGFITMTGTLADHIREVYKINVPHGIFMAYPNWIDTPDFKRREIVYIDNSGSIPIGFLPHLGFLDKITKETGIPTLFVSKKFTQKAKEIVLKHKLQVRCESKKTYDYGSEFGILMNTNNFNQAEESMPRKFLTYLMCGMKPLMDDCWTECIEYAEENRIHPLIYQKAEDINKQGEHNWGMWDNRYFCMEERTIDLASELERLSDEASRV